MKKAFIILFSLLMALSAVPGTAFFTPGEPVGYTSHEITPPPEIIRTREEMLNAINYNLLSFPEAFSIRTAPNFSESLLPRQIIEVEYSFIEGVFAPKTKILSNGKEITYSVGYNSTGKVAAFYKAGRAIPAEDYKAVELYKKLEEIKSLILRSGMAQTDIADAVHDYIILHCAYDDETEGFRTAYGALVTGLANCQGYAEGLSILLTAAGIENRIVWAKSLVSGTGTHGFVKAKIDGAWYNIDCTVDDPTPDRPNRLKRDYLMVDDSVSMQRYEWEFDRYPASTVSHSNWHYRNGYTASTKAEFRQFVTDAVAARQPHVSVWVEDYNKNAKYNAKWIRSLPGVADVTTSITGAAEGTEHVQTAVYITLEYDN